MKKGKHNKPKEQNNVKPVDKNVEQEEKLELLEVQEKEQEELVEKVEEIEKESGPKEEPVIEEDGRKITKKDVILMLIITLVYAFVSFINLGSTKNPQTFWHAEEVGDSAIFRIKQGTVDVSKFRYYSGADFGNYEFLASYNGIDYGTPLTISTDKVFAWEDYGLVGDFQYIKIVAKKANLYLGEFAVYDTEGNQLELEALNENAKLIVDEQDVIPEEISYMNSTYFDEIYFARTAYEHLHNLPIYEWTHPPLGKLIMAIPMAFMGMSTFSYRLMGNIAGILMIPTMYVFAKMIFKKRKYAVLAAIIMAADGMHFVQSRLGTADGFLVLFIMLEYLFMYKYIISEDKPLRKRLWCLFFSGLFMGLAISTKWSGVFAAIGLAIVFFVSLAIKIFGKKQRWSREDTITICSCFGFFVLIPVVIYALSYIPYYIVENAYIHDFKTFMEWQEAMYNYHHDLVATHPYSSMWYTWPITKQSILYYVGTTNDGGITRIALLGNPAIWWFSIPCLAYVLISAIWTRKFKYWFLVIPIVSMMISYVGVDRIMFLYHYFPVLPFVMLSILAVMEFFCEKLKTNIPMYIFAMIIVVVFIYFYPVYSGFPTTNEYLQGLKWIKTWIW